MVKDIIQTSIDDAEVVAKVSVMNSLPEIPNPLFAYMFHKEFTYKKTYFMNIGNRHRLYHNAFVNRNRSNSFCEIADRLTIDMQNKNARRVYNYKTPERVDYDKFYIKLSKTVFDEMDTALAKHYGVTAEELDFIINYDIKYRMGDKLKEE